MEYGNLVSVIVPVYNVEKYLRRCVDSLINQTYENLEIILVNDGSTDGSADICNSLLKEDKRIRVVHKKNGGLSSARNEGLDIAKGAYVSFIDSDDYITLTMIENMVALMCKNQAQIAITGRIDKYELTGTQVESFKKETVQLYSSDEAIKELLLMKKIDVSVCDKIFEKNLFENVRFPLGENNEDCAIIFEIFSKIKNAVHTDTCDYYYCHRENSITTIFSIKTVKNMVNHVENIFEFIQSSRPQMIDEARYFLGMAYILAYRNISKRFKCHKEKDEIVKDLYFHLKKQIRKFFGLGKKKIYFNNGQKRFFRLIDIGLYDTLMITKHIFSTGKRNG